MDIGKTLKRFRKEAGLTQKQVAGALNTSRSSYSKIEEDKLELRLSQFFALCTLFCISPQNLLRHMQPR